MHNIINLCKKIKPIGFSGLSIYDVTIFFWKGLIKGAITTRASSLAFNFFLAFFPSIIVFFTLIPYIPISGIQETLIELLAVILPPSTNEITFETLDPICQTRTFAQLLQDLCHAKIFFSTSMLIDPKVHTERHDATTQLSDDAPLCVSMTRK